MRKRLYLFILICWLAGVLTLLWYPMLGVPRMISRITWYDKAAHLVFFGVMMYLFLAIGIAWQKFKFRSVALFSFFVVTLIDLLGEYVQSFIPGRIPSYLDFLAGLIGILAAIPLAYMIHHSPRKKILLHVCCAPCASAVAEILDRGHKLELYFFNPNIHPRSEYDKRLAEVKKLAGYFGVKLRIGEYNREAWLDAVGGREADPEGGRRCEICFQHRLQATADLASRKNIGLFGTSLTISPHKNSYQVNRVGSNIADLTGVNFLAEDFKENNGWQRSLVLSKKFGFYRQKYCGCEFSAPNAKRAARNS
ncbi:MAG TPA: epoxyqueuosine reductase QueH [Candidatus Nanoarchaeia archaeon]|nr:epoxyqueuosine reductase QueH [Candidatus Nanoarchaeia archaeon]